MTNSEAIDQLLYIRDEYAPDTTYDRKAIAVAIKALEENEQLKSKIEKLEDANIQINLQLNEVLRQRHS